MVPPSRQPRHAAFDFDRNRHDRSDLDHHAGGDGLRMGGLRVLPRHRHPEGVRQGRRL